MNNMELWDKVKQVPPHALKPISAGRLKGKSDINPQWRIQAMTEIYGPCGVGWGYEIIRLWTEKHENEISAHAHIKLIVKDSMPIHGVGGSMLISEEDEKKWDGSKMVSTGNKHPYHSDEAYKMAVTDALGVAMKFLGVGADVYMGLWDGSKYRDIPKNKEQGNKPPSLAGTLERLKQPEQTPAQKAAAVIDSKSTVDELEELKKLWTSKKVDKALIDLIDDKIYLLKGADELEEGFNNQINGGK